MAYYETELMHYGIKGQKWGFRRFQNEDGTLTSEGKSRYDMMGNREGLVSRQKNTPPKHAKVDGFIKGKHPKGAIVERGEPRTRWGRGKKIQDEMYELQKKKEDQLRSNSKEFQKNKNTLDYLEKKYGFDRYTTENDNQNPKRHEFSKEERKAAKEKYWQKIVDQSFLDSNFEEKAAHHAERAIEKKYGKTGMADVKHYNNVNSTVAISILGAITLAAMYGSRKKP